MVTTLSDYVASKFHASHLITTAIHVMIVGFSIEIQAPCVQANVQHMLAIPSREARKRTNIRVPPGHNKCVTNNLLPHSRSRLPTPGYYSWHSRTRPRDLAGFPHNHSLADLGFLPAPYHMDIGSASLQDVAEAAYRSRSVQAGSAVQDATVEDRDMAVHHDSQYLRHASRLVCLGHA
jgi:hypothetical protein